MVKSRLLSTLALWATFFALGVIALGAFTRLMDAGLGCPDWPGCYGHLIVPTSVSSEQAALTPLVTYKAWAEMIHRYFVGGLSLFILAIIALILGKKTYRSRSNVIFSILLTILLIYQILLGQWTVTYKLLPIVVTQHLLGGFFILVILWAIYLNNRVYAFMPMTIPQDKKIIAMTSLALFFVIAQIALGAWTSTNYASLSCPDFPFCINEQPLQTLEYKKAFTLISPVGVNYEGGVLPTPVRQTIQMTHRFGALFVTLYLMALVIFIFIKNRADVFKNAYLILSVLIVQICLGVSNVIFKLPLATAILHNLFAALLLLSVITLLYKLISPNRLLDR